jgi:large subunit ribosomal protein L19
MELKNIKISPVDIEARKKIDMRSGDTVRVWQKIKEGDKTRLQAFEGMILAIKHGKENGGTFTVRRVIDEIGVERIFPLYSPVIDSIEVLKRAKVRRSKLYYIREKATKELKRHLKSTLLEARKESNTDTKKAAKEE